MLFGHLYIVSEKMLNSLSIFFKQVVYFLVTEYLSSLYILDINLLSDILLANYFSHSVGCLFILLTVSFAFEFDVVPLVYFCCLCFWCQIQKSLQDQCQRVNCLYFLLGVLRFQVSCSTAFNLF